MANKTLAVKVATDVKGADKVKGLAGSFASLGADVLKFGAIAGGALVAVGGVTAGFASDLNESLSKVGVVFGDWAEDIEHWSEDAAKSMGISQQAALEAAGTFGNLFSAMGIGKEETVDMSTGLVELASDLASFNNLDPTEVLEKLRAGVVGEAEPLRALGVNISAARTEAKALELGLWDGESALSASAKAQANYALILEDTTLAQGDFARTSDGMANQQRTLAATFDDTMAQIGQAFVPIIEAILPQVTAGLTAFGDWVTANGPAIGGVLSAIATGIGQAFTFITTIAIPALVAGFEWITTNVLPGLVAAFDWISVNVIPALVAAFEGVVAWVTEHWPTISSIFDQVFGAIANAVSVIWPIVAQIAEVLFPLVVATAGWLLEQLDGVFKLLGGVFEVFGNVVSFVVDAVISIWKDLQGFFRRAVKAFEWIGDHIFAPIGEGFEAAIGFVKGVWNTFARWWNGIQISVPSIEIPYIGTFGGFTVGLPDLPTFAEGGIATRPTLGIFGEAKPEALIPLDRLGEFGGPREVHYHTHLTVQGDIEARNTAEVEDSLLRVSRFSAVGGQA